MTRAASLLVYGLKKKMFHFLFTRLQCVGGRRGYEISWLYFAKLACGAKKVLIDDLHSLIERRRQTVFRRSDMSRPSGSSSLMFELHP